MGRTDHDTHLHDPHSLTPTKADRFSFGLWTVGWQARDQFGDASRAPLDPIEAVHRLAELGAYGITFHDDDLVPFGASAADRDKRLAEFRQALDETGLVVPMVTTNLFTHPVFKDGGFTSNDRSVRRYALRKVLRNIELAAELGAQTFVLWGGREGSEYDSAKDVRAALDRYREAMNLLTEFVTDRGYGIRFALEPKPNEPRGDILLPTVGQRAGLHRHPGPARAGRRQPRGRPRADGRAELRAQRRAGAVARQAVPHRPQRPAQHQVRPGPGVRPRRPAQRLRRWWTCWSSADRPVPTAAGPAYTGPRHFDYKPSRTEDYDGRLGLGARQHAHLPDPQGAGRGVPRRPRGAAGAGRRPGGRAVPARPWPTGEGYAELLADRSAFEDFDADQVAERGYGFVRLNQLALEHLTGAR